MKNEHWFELDIAQVEKKLKTNAASGLSRKAARSRWNHASGGFWLSQSKSPLRMLGELLADFSLVLLLLGAVFALFFEDFQNGISVLAISGVYVAVSFALYYRTQRSLEAMQACFRPMARVIRDGKLYYIDFSRVVLGDVLLLERGDVVAADVRLVTSDALSVTMQVDRESFVCLDKYAGTAPRANENDVTKLCNMLHAGSVVESGYARGIVTAVGKYTYLAARTGGIPEPAAQTLPSSLKRMKNFCSWVGMISLLCVLPFCLVSLFISHFNHGEVLLSSAFLTALSIAAASMAPLTLTLYKAFFAIAIRRAAQAKTPSAVRSPAALDGLLKSEYLFVLDGAALTDGKMHFDSALTFEGAVKRYDLLTPSASMLGHLTALYCMAEKRSLSVGMDESDLLSDALGEFCQECRVDQGALAIRYPSLTYFPGNSEKAPNSVRYTEHGEERWLSLSLSDILSECQMAIMHGRETAISAEGLSRLQNCRKQYLAEGKRVMILSSLAPQSGVRTFVGMLVLRDGRDPALLKHVSALRRVGLQPIFFVPSSPDEKLPRMPQEIMQLPSVSVKELHSRKLPMTHELGKYMRYDDVTEDDVLALFNDLKKQKKRVAVLTFSDAMPRLIEAADTVITCATVKVAMGGDRDEELRAMETDGAQTSASCLQTLKQCADVLIARPQRKGGGLGALLLLRRMALDAYHNLAEFFRYALSAQLMRLLAVALPMVFGSAALNARHILVCSFGIDLVALILFCRRVSAARDYEPESRDFLSYVKRHEPLWIASAVGALSLVLLPRAMDFLAWIGAFDYKVEFSFCAILYLHLTALFFVLIGQIKNKTDLLHQIGFWGLVLGTVAFLILCFAVEPIGVLFDVDRNPLAYALLAFAPSILFAATYVWLGRRTGRERPER